MKEFDLLAFVLHEVMKQHPSYSEAQAKELLPRLHAELGGDSYYVPKRSPAELSEARDAAMRDANDPAKTSREVQSAHGLSRATIYRLRKSRSAPP